MNDATSGLIDIIEPAPPAAIATHASLTWVVAAAVLLLLAGWVIGWRRRRCRRAARKQLRQLRLALQTGVASQQDTAYALAAELARMFKLRQLQAGAPPDGLPQTAHADWAYLVTRLDEMRYQTDAGTDDQTWARLFAIAESALRRSGRC